MDNSALIVGGVLLLLYMSRRSRPVPGRVMPSAQRVPPYAGSQGASTEQILAGAFASMLTNAFNRPASNGVPSSVESQRLSMGASTVGEYVYDDGYWEDEFDILV